MKKYIKEFGVKVLQKLHSYGFEVQIVRGIDKEIVKLNSINDLNSRLLCSEKLVEEYPQHPKAQMELIQSLHKMNDNRQFEQMNRYASKLQAWLTHTELQELRNIEFISNSMVVGSFGNHYALENLLRANEYGLRVKKKLFMLLPENIQLRNPTLFSYFEPYINVIRDMETIQAMKGFESFLTLPLGIGLPMNDICPFLDIAANLNEIEQKKIGIKGPLLHLKKEHYDIGKQVLRKLGLPDDAWYVTLHVREPGYRGESRKNTTEEFRNANPLDYVNACKVITNAGGWVFRMGDPSMTALPKMPQVIDYARTGEIRSDLMDVFLGATCRFLIGSASGYLRLPRYFGVPVLFTNSTNTVPYFSLTENDLYLPRLLKYKGNGNYLSFEENISPPISMLTNSQHFLNMGLGWANNTPEELEIATIEMLEKTDDNSSSKNEDDLQRRFKIVAEKCGQKYGGHPVKAFASISSEFLHKHVDLL